MCSEGDAMVGVLTSQSKCLKMLFPGLKPGGKERMEESKQRWNVVNLGWNITLVYKTEPTDLRVT